MQTEVNVNQARPSRRPQTPPDRVERRRASANSPKVVYPFRKHHTQAALRHCELSTRPGDEKHDCRLKVLARRLINAEGEWLAGMREDEAATVQAVFGLQIEWQSAKGARWTGSWTVPLPGGREIQEEVIAFEQFLAGRPEPKAMKTAADSIHRVATLMSDYLADMAAHAARPAPWNEDEPKARPAREHDLHNRPI